MFEVCNPPAVQTILDIHPEVSVFLPCRISLYEENGDVILSTIGIDNIIDNFELITPPNNIWDIVWWSNGI